MSTQDQSDPERGETSGEQTIEAGWTVELNCECPTCLRYVDLLAYPDFWDGRKLDIAEHDTDRSRSVDVVCPECGAEFLVHCVY